MYVYIYIYTYIIYIYAYIYTGIYYTGPNPEINQGVTGLYSSCVFHTSIHHTICITP